MNRLAIALAAGLLFCAAPAIADWREDMGTFRVAIAAGSNPALAVARSEPFRLALEEALRLPVEIVTARDYPALIDAARRSRVEYAILSASAFAALWASCECMEPLAIASSGDGSTGFSAALFARQDGADTVASLKGRKIAVVAGDSIGGGLLALHEMRAAGLDVAEGDAELVRFETTDKALGALADGSVAAFIGWVPVGGEQFEDGGVRGTIGQIASRPAGAFAYRILWRSSPIPHRVHAIRKDLAGEAKNLLRSLIANLFGSDPVAYDAIEPAFGGGFIATRNAQFEALSDMFRAKGLGAPAGPR